MKKIFSVIALLLFIQANAQFKKGSKEKIRSLKIAHITEKLDLTTQEAEKFWPVYNKYDKMLLKLRMEDRMSLKRKLKELGGLEAIDENTAKDISKKMVALDKQFFEVKNEFHQKLSKIISYKKILQLEIAESEFHRKLLRKFRGKKRTKKREAN